MINDTKNIRPYGIILIKKDVLKDYPSVEKQFKEKFRYKKFKKEIEKYIQSYWSFTLNSNDLMKNIKFLKFEIFLFFQGLYLL